MLEALGSSDVASMREQDVLVPFLPFPQLQASFCSIVAGFVMTKKMSLPGDDDQSPLLVSYLGYSIFASRANLLYDFPGLGNPALIQRLLEEVFDRWHEELYCGG